MLLYSQSIFILFCVFLNEELPSNSVGKTATSAEKFKWNPYTASSAVARACGIHTISGNQKSPPSILFSHFSFVVSKMVLLCLFLTILREVVTVCRNHHQEEMVLP